MCKKTDGYYNIGREEGVWYIYFESKLNPVSQKSYPARIKFRGDQK